MIPFRLLFFFLRPTFLSFSPSSSGSNSSLLSRSSALTFAADDNTSSTVPWDASRPQSSFAVIRQVQVKTAGRVTSESKTRWSKHQRNRVCTVCIRYLLFQLHLQQPSSLSPILQRLGRHQHNQPQSLWKMRFNTKYPLNGDFNV